MIHKKLKFPLSLPKIIFPLVIYSLLLPETNTAFSSPSQPKAFAHEKNGQTKGKKKSAPRTEVVQTAPETYGLTCENHAFPFAFRGESRGFSPEDAYWMVWMSIRAELSHLKATEDELRRIGYDRFVAINHPSSGVQGFVASNGTHTIIAFRGSDDVIDWVGNFHFHQVEGSGIGVGGKVHAGFASNLNAVWTDVMKALGKVDGFDQDIWVTGHSLGGALATITSLRLARLGASIAGVYSFAAPRSGNDEYVRDLENWVGDRYFRVVVSDDLVPRLAPTPEGARSFGPLVPEKIRDWTIQNLLGPLNYRHHGELLWFDQSGEPFFYKNHDGEDDRGLWERIVAILEEDGTSKGLPYITERQKRLHDTRTYACHVQSLFLKIEALKLGDSNAAKRQTL